MVNPILRMGLERKDGSQLGELEIVLRADVLPRTAAHFLTISPKLRGARMVRNIPGAYCEFRAPIAVVDPSGETETREDGKTSLQHVRRGILSVAGDRVVLLFAEMPSLDASHHVLGIVVEGEAVLAGIENGPQGQEVIISHCEEMTLAESSPPSSSSSSSSSSRRGDRRDSRRRRRSRSRSRSGSRSGHRSRRRRSSRSRSPERSRSRKRRRKRRTSRSRSRQRRRSRSPSRGDRRGRGRSRSRTRSLPPPRDDARRSTQRHPSDGVDGVDGMDRLQRANATPSMAPAPPPPPQKQMKNSVLQALLPMARARLGLPAEEKTATDRDMGSGEEDARTNGETGGKSPSSGRSQDRMNGVRGVLLTDTGHHGSQGLRMTMEDECDIQRWTVKGNKHISGPVAFMAVFDGHGGRGAAIHARDTVSGLVRAELDQGHPPETALRNAYLQADRTSLMDGSGTTAVSVLVELDTGELWCANAGDSRAVLCREEKAIPLSKDHKPGDLEERTRITEAGGRVVQFPGGIPRVVYWKDDVYLSLACARAIGDNHYNRLGDVITAEPDVTANRMTGDRDFVLLACDGLWDVMGTEQAVEVVKGLLQESPELSVEQICRFMCEQAIQMGSHDNVSVALGITPMSKRQSSLGEPQQQQQESADKE